MRNDNVSIDATVEAIQKSKERDFWTKQFSGKPDKVCFPYDKTGDVSSTHSLEKLEFHWTDELYQKLFNVMKGSDYKLFMLLTTGVFLLLHKYTDKDDITLGAPVVKQNIEGKLINTMLALRSHIDQSITFKDYLLKVRQIIIEGTEHQNYPIKSILNQLNSGEGTEVDSNPLFDSVILLTDIHDKNYIKDIQANLIFSFTKGDNCLKGELEYNTHRYDNSTIEKIKEHLAILLSEVLGNPGKQLKDIEILSPAEKKLLLGEFNNTKEEYNVNRSIGELFSYQVERSTDQLAAVYQEKQMSYGEMQKKAFHLATLLRKKGIKKQDIIGLMVDRSIEMLFGILGILYAGGAYLPMDSEYPGDRNLFLLKDSGTAILLWQKSVMENNREILDYLSIEQTILLDEIPSITKEETNKHAINHPNDPAYVIYTSGTSGAPKGVIVQHKNVLNLVFGLNKRIYQQFQKQMHISMVSPYVFDASVKQIFTSLLMGHSLFVVPQETRADAMQLILYYFRYQIEVSDGTPTHLSLLWDIFQNDGYKGESIKNFPLKQFIIGGEAMSRQIIERFLSLFKDHTPIITNVYGPTECCVDTSSYSISVENLHLFNGIPIGKPMPNYYVYILARNGRLQPPNISGELCIAGDGVSHGYLNRPQLTNDKFIKNPYSNLYPSTKEGETNWENNPPSNIIGETLYKTGDLARWYPDGNIEYIGRIDRQVKIRGFRVELGEIESQLLNHDSINTAIVLLREDKENDKILCAYYVSATELQQNDLRDFLAARLPYYLIPQYFIPIEKIPLTWNGKVDRKALPVPKPDLGETYTLPQTDTERKLGQIWSEILGIEKNQIGIDANFFRLGGHSLNATVLINRLYQELEIKLPLVEIFNNPTIRELAEYLEKTEGYKFLSIPLAEKKEYYSLTSSQKRMFIVKQMETGSKSYNTPSVSIVEGQIDLQQIEKTFAQLINRHEGLRSYFFETETEPVQRIADEVDFEILNRDIPEEIDDEGISDLIKEFIQPFDLSQAPLMRVGLFRKKATEYILIVDMHHIIGDVVSYGILVNDFIQLYNGKTLPLLKVQYKDYSEWHKSGRQQGRLKAQENYWLNRFRGEVPRLNLPTDYPRPKIRRVDEGYSLEFLLSDALAAQVTGVVEQTESTVFMFLLAVFNIFIARYTKQEDIIVGTPIACREHAEIQNVIGVFLNMLPLRNQPRGHKTFSQFLQEVKENSLNDYENQEYPFDDLVVKLGLQGDTSRNPLFDIEFANINLEHRGYKERIQGLMFKPHNNKLEFAKFDLHFQVTEAAGKIHFLVRYSTQLFKHATIEKMKKYYLEILEQITENIAIKISDIKLSHDFLVVKPKNYTEEEGGFKL